MATTAKSVILRDKDDGKQLLPMTRAELVIRNDGTSVETSLTNKEDTTNKVTSLSSSSTDTEYPSAKAVFDALGSAGGGTEHNLRVPASAVFMPSSYNGAGGDSKNVNPQLYSSRTFSWSDLHNVGIIHRGVYNKMIQDVSIGTPQSIFGIYQSENTYLRIYFHGGIQIKCSLVVNGTTTQDVQLMADYRAALTGYGDNAFVLDRDKRVIRIYGYNTGTSTITKVAEYDVSQWDLSSFTNVYIAAHVQNITNCMCCVTVLVNSPLTLGDYIAAPLYVGEWNTPIGTRYYEDITLAGTGIEVGGTVTQTISATDKVVSVSNASLDYFKLGPSNLGDDWQYFWYHVKMRFSSVGDGMYITGGRFWQKVIIEDADGLPVTTLQTGDDKWYPAIDTDYHLYYQFIHTSNDAIFGQTYQRNYGLKLYGTATLEASEPYMYNPQVQNLCAETYNGAGFDGAIPFDGVCQFLDYEVTRNYTPSTMRIPLGALFFDKVNHIIYMWEGSVWKRISNA